jgi:hypothetical protein
MIQRPEITTTFMINKLSDIIAIDVEPNLFNDEAGIKIVNRNQPYAILTTFQNAQGDFDSNKFGSLYSDMQTLQTNNPDFCPLYRSEKDRSNDITSCERLNPFSTWDPCGCTMTVFPCPLAGVKFQKKSGVL